MGSRPNIVRQILYMKQASIERFLNFIDFTNLSSNNFCWKWKGGKWKGGYGRFSIDYRDISAHRWSYEYYLRPITSGKLLDHLCRNTDCVNPIHLEEVDTRENVIRGLRSQLNPNKTSKYSNVYYNKRDKKWYPRICKDNKTYCLGAYDDEEDAYVAVQDYFKSVL